MFVCVRVCACVRCYPYHANKNATVGEEIGQMFEIRELQCAVACMPTRRSSLSKRNGFHRINILQTNYFRANWRSN